MTVGINITPVATGGYAFKIYYAGLLAEQGFRLNHRDAVEAACNAARRVLGC